MLAYCTALGLRCGHLVYAKGAVEPIRHVVRRSGVEIVCHALDLAQPPAVILADVAGIVDELAATTRAA